MFEDGYRIEEPTEYDAACEYRHELEPRNAIAESEEWRRRFIRCISAIEAAERRLEKRRELEARRADPCTVEGCAGQSAVEDNPDSVCDACLFAYLLRAHIAAAESMVNPWTTADDRYFAHQRDAEHQQHWLREKRQRHANRVAAYIRRRGAWTKAAERDFLATRFTITQEGERALRAAELQEHANRDSERAVANGAHIFDEIVGGFFPNIRTRTATAAS